MDYNFDDAFIPDKKIKPNRKPRKNAKQRTAIIVDGKDVRIPTVSDTSLTKINVRPQKTFVGDTRVNFKIVGSCATCIYGVFPRNKLRRGYCALATNKKIKNQTGKKYIISQGVYEKNPKFAEMNWVKTHSSSTCDEIKLSVTKIKQIKKWVE